MKKATTKRERKYGKKEEDELKKLEPKKPSKKEPEEMYKVLIDRANFTHAMSYDKCVEYINNQNKRATRMFNTPPSMTLVKV